MSIVKKFGESVASWPTCSRIKFLIYCKTFLPYPQTGLLTYLYLQIKALEQQQCQLLAVREIPDKPPPPYTPPADVRTPKASRTFQVDDTIDDKVYKQLCKKNDATVEGDDIFDVFLQDFCEETVNKQKLEQSDKPWDACNLLPQKSPINTEKLATSATAAVKELLSGIGTTAVSGKPCHLYTYLCIG